jgi:predicted 3-demethylubiquinone-9 3-methyltransferase (glyoxalase superfamily)
MGRLHTFMDQQFGGADYDPDDQGTFEEGLVFVIMPFSGPEMDEVYSAIKDECSKLQQGEARG